MDAFRTKQTQLAGVGFLAVFAARNDAPSIGRSFLGMPSCLWVALVLWRHSDKSRIMAEETIWRGTSSQLKYLGTFILCGLFCWLIVPIFIALTRYLQTKNNVIELTTERLKMTEGIFSKVTETLELYRVKDIEVRQPFIYRMLGVENIQIKTSDLSSPEILLEAMPKTVALADKLRNQVEIIRVQKKVREIDLE